MADIIIAAFRSRQQVQRFESLLRQQGLGATMINTPHQVAIGCGVSVQLEGKDLDRARRIYEANRASLASLVGFYRAQGDGMRLRITPVYSAR